MLTFVNSLCAGVSKRHRCLLLRTGKCERRWYTRHAMALGGDDRISPFAPGGGGDDPDRGASNSKKSVSKQALRPDLAKKCMEKVAEQFSGGPQALRKSLGNSCASAIAETFPSKMNPAGIVMCGPGPTGEVGFHIALELQRQGYDITVLACEQNKCVDETAARDAGMSYIDFLPGPVEAIFDFFVDAMLGMEGDNRRISEPYSLIVEKIANSEKPTVSIDVPTGWDPSKGPRDEDLWRGVVLKPDLLLSLGIPKSCTRRFGGAFHFVVGDVLSEEVLSGLDLSLPSFPHHSDYVLVGGNPALFGWGKNPGEVYGAEAVRKNHQRDETVQRRGRERQTERGLSSQEVTFK